MIRIAAAAALVPGLAAAHAGPAGHAHPHGLEGLAIAALVVGLGILIWRRVR